MEGKIWLITQFRLLLSCFVACFFKVGGVKGFRTDYGNFEATSRHQRDSAIPVEQQQYSPSLSY
jgi:hypothetical protein